MFKHLYVLVIVFIFSSCSSSKKEESKLYDYNPNKYQEKQMSGIDFFASGSSPYWSLDMDTEDSTRIFLHNQNLISYKSPVPLIDTAGKTIIYKFSDFATLTIKGNVCVNSSGGEQTEFSTTLIYNDSTFSGCGKYIIASKNPFLSQETLRLNDIWALRSINDKAITKEDFKKGIPIIELHLNDGRFYGKAECNELSGNINFGDSFIYFKNFSLTKIFCEGDFEDNYINTLKIVDSWELDKMYLILRSKGKEVLKYIKID